MSTHRMMGMLSGMGHQLGIDQPAQEEQPGRQHSDGRSLQNHAHTILPQRCGLDRFLLLNLRHNLVNHWLGQEPAFDVFLHTPL